MRGRKRGWPEPAKSAAWRSRGRVHRLGSIDCASKERTYSLSLYDVFDASGAKVVSVPVVNGWVQASIPLRRLPTSQESRGFFSVLGTNASRMHRRGLVSSWFFLHKPPGLLIRFETADAASLLRDLIPMLDDCGGTWVGRYAFDSYFEQRELLSEAYGYEAYKVLLTSCTEYCRAVASGRAGTLGQWTDFLAVYLAYYLQDPWLVWEALGRFQRLRQQTQDAAIPSHHVRRNRLVSPSRLMAQLARCVVPEQSIGFEASTTLLMCLNYILNQWGICQQVQRRILHDARSRFSPGICPDENNTVGR
jgi:hypothetical protein